MDNENLYGNVPYGMYGILRAHWTGCTVFFARAVRYYVRTTYVLHSILLVVHVSVVACSKSLVRYSYVSIHIQFTV